MATTASMGTFATAFLSKPLGAVVFGHFGDRLGRKKTLVATLLIMGLCTVGVGLVPGTAAIGVAAPLILVVLRLLQGIAVGGEWAGSALLSAEYAPVTERGRYGMFIPLGGSAAGVLTCVTSWPPEASSPVAASTPWLAPIWPPTPTPTWGTPATSSYLPVCWAD